MKTHTKKEDGIDWVNMMKIFVMENAKVLAANAAGEVRKKIKTVISESTQRFITSTLIFIGLIFLMIGLAVFINEAVGNSNSIGYVVVGILVVAGGVIMKDGIGKKKEN